MILRRTLLIGCLALASCRSQAPAASSPQASSTPRSISRRASRTAHGSGTAIALRLSRKGGDVRAYRLPGLTELPGAIRGRLPGVARVVGIDLESELLFVTTANGELLSLDLGTSRVDTQATNVVVAAMGPDGTLFAIDGRHHVTSVARRVRMVWPQAVNTVPRDLFGGLDQRLFAVTAGDSAHPATLRLVTLAAGQPAAARQLPFAGDVEATRWGDLMSVVGDSGILLVDPIGRRDPGFVALPDHPRAIAFSPSGHRVYVASRNGPGLAVIDRYDREELDGIALPTPVATVRLDPFGRWLLARPSIGDSVWVVDLPIRRLTGSVATSWTQDLPAIAPDGSLLVAQGQDVIALRPDSLRETGRIPGASADLWLFTTWRSRNAVRLASDADTTSATPSGTDSLAATGPLYVQVSISQNESWSTEMAQQLSRAGLEAKVLPPKSADDGYRVVLGPYPNRGQAETIGRKLGRPYWIYQP